MRDNNILAEELFRQLRAGRGDGTYERRLTRFAKIDVLVVDDLPGMHEPQRWLFALHIEFCVVLWSLAAVAAAIDRQLVRPAPPMSWVIFFLFPAYFYFAPCGTADHVLGFFAITTALSAAQFWIHPEPSRAALLAVTSAGAVLTRYQAVFVLLPVALVVFVACGRAWLNQRFRLGAARATRRLTLTLSVLLGLGALLVSPHFVKNWIFHCNPVYPLMQDVFASSPSMPDAALYFRYSMNPTRFTATGSMGQRLSRALEMLSKLSLLPRQNIQAAASLASLLLPGLIWMRRRSISAVFAVIGVGSLLVWGMTLFDTRYLVIHAPLLAAFAGAVVIDLWRRGFWGRCAVAPVLLLYMLWTLDAPFADFPGAHIQSSLNLIKRSFNGNPEHAFRDYRRGFVELGAKVPRDAKLLIHTFGISLGINRDLVMDSVGFQGLIDYRKLRTPRELFDELRALGITHLVHQPNGIYASPTIQEDVVFFALVSRFGTPIGEFEGMFLSALGEAPPVEAPYRVLSLGISSQRDGLYRIEQLFSPLVLPVNERPSPRPERVVTDAGAFESLKAVDAVVCDPAYRFDEEWSALLDQHFQKLGNRIERWSLYLKLPESSLR